MIENSQIVRSHALSDCEVDRVVLYDNNEPEEPPLIAVPFDRVGDEFHEVGDVGDVEVYLAAIDEATDVPLDLIRIKRPSIRNSGVPEI